jgi:hypothetical protein
MNIEVYRGAGDNPAPQEIVSEFLTTDAVGRFRCTAELNENDSDRKTIDADGPKNSVMTPTKLVRVKNRSEIRSGILNMFARTYQQDGNQYSITSHMTIEIKA